MINGSKVITLGGFQGSDFMSEIQKLSLERYLVLPGRAMCADSVTDPLVEVYPDPADDKTCKMVFHTRDHLRTMHHIADRLHIVNTDVHDIGYYSDIAYAVMGLKKITMKSYHSNNMALIEPLLMSFRDQIRKDIADGKMEIDAAWFIARFGYPAPEVIYDLGTILNWTGVLLQDLITDARKANYLLST